MAEGLGITMSLPVATFLVQCVVWPLAGLAYRSLRTTYQAINLNIAESTRQLVMLNGRLGRLEQWRDDHQRDDDRAHAAFGELRRAFDRQTGSSE